MEPVATAAASRPLVLHATLVVRVILCATFDASFCVSVVSYNFPDVFPVPPYCP